MTTRPRLQDHQPDARDVDLVRLHARALRPIDVERLEITQVGQPDEDVRVEVAESTRRHRPLAGA
jgi:hypothetical protein